MKILVLGSGAREHALVRHFLTHHHTVYCVPGNPGILHDCNPIKSTETYTLSDHTGLAKLARRLECDLTVVGPEAPLAEGIVDTFTEYGLSVFGPLKRAARLESDKSWSKTLKIKYGIPTAESLIAHSFQALPKTIEEAFDRWNGIALKYSGLYGGKGVMLCDTHECAREVLQHLAQTDLASSHLPWVIEEKLEGPEVSILALTDSKSILPLIPAQDHKALLDGDLGPNTGGMGAYAPYPLPEEHPLDELTISILEPSLKALIAEGIDYRGVIYVGLILTAGGPKVLEYNCRFGDPEAEAVLPLLESDLAPYLLSCAKGKLLSEPLRWKEGMHSTTVVLASSGYPQSPRKGDVIRGLNTVPDTPNIDIFHAGTTQTPEGEICTNGGRVLAINALGSSLAEARQNCYGVIDKINFEGVQYRSDIGTRHLTPLTMR